MSTESSVYLGFVDGASHHTRNLASSAWVIYSPEGLLVSSGGICLGPSMNNVAKYSVVIELLRDAISHGILSLEVRLDSQLVVCQLNGRYHVLDLTLLCRFLRVRLLERQFDFITYFHIPRSSNHVSDAYANYVLDWHLSH
jgi:ribonuclease HI